MFAVIEDDNISRQILSKVLEVVGKVEVIDFATAESFLRDVKINDYELKAIFIDLTLPGMTGIEAITKIRNIDKYSKTPIVVCSAKSDKVTIVQALKAGAQNFLTKPLNKDNIVTTICALSA